MRRGASSDWLTASAQFSQPLMFKKSRRLPSRFYSIYPSKFLNMLFLPAVCFRRVFLCFFRRLFAVITAEGPHRRTPPHYTLIHLKKALPAGCQTSKNSSDFWDNFLPAWPFVTSSLNLHKFSLQIVDFPENHGIIKETTGAPVSSVASVYWASPPDSRDTFRAERRRKRP